MLRRLSSLHIVSWPDISLFTLVIVGVLVVIILWSLPDSVADRFNQSTNKYLLAILFLGAAAVVAILPRFLPSWKREERSALAAAMVRFGIALEILAVLASGIAVYFASDPARSVPIGFAAFTGILLGLIVAGIGGNKLAPPRA
jgi:hypothetical protein